ncbi:hypothetical protein C2S52_014180 [Perilla frutescens var. hirtella]|nr:hypothetical protein C2S51_016384 [Perilla frutescens var. frutescens]KAH6776619.1 hypothetical protein C2S52_014180 [Perilla frutescens var. hirtella]
MSSFALTSMLCLAVLLPLFVPSLSQGQPKYCPAPDIPRKGSCGSNGLRECVLLVLGQYPASKMPSKIRCVNVGKNKSKCTSSIVCG